MHFFNINFGTHRDKSLPQILLLDPDWFFWAIESNAFKSASLFQQAKILDGRAKAIRIPNNARNELCIEHIIQPGNYSYARFDVIDKKMPEHTGGSRTVRADYLDLSFPRKLQGYDKLGNRLLLKSFKEHILGNGNIKITKKVAEEFFKDENNFAV